MNRIRYCGLVLVLACASAPPAAAPPGAPAGAAVATPPATPAPRPPVAQREPHSETLHGLLRSDDYFWLRRKGTPEVETYLRTEQLLSERIQRVDSIAWVRDNHTLFYVTEDDAKRPFKLWRHSLGDDPAHDASVYEEKDAKFNLGVSRSRSDAYVLLESGSHT